MSHNDPSERLKHGPGGIEHMPERKRLLLDKLIRALGEVEGLAALVLGGSYANRTHHEASDLDMGLYYVEGWPFCVAEVRQIADSLSVAGSATVTDFYEWGPWVNGGAWIHSECGKVDLLYRNLDQVWRTVEDAHT